MKYTLYPGNIASMLHIQPEGGKMMDCIYMAAEKQPVIFLSGRKNEAAEAAAFMALPLSVRVAANRHFGGVFSLPVNERSQYLRHCVPWEVAA